VCSLLAVGIIDYKRLNVHRLCAEASRKKREEGEDRGGRRMIAYLWTFPELRHQLTTIMALS
jgi:hypothetical protein